MDYGFEILRLLPRGEERIWRRRRRRKAVRVAVASMSVEEQEIQGGFQVGRGGLLCCVVLDASGMVFCTQFDRRLLILPS